MNRFHIEPPLHQLISRNRRIDAARQHQQNFAVDTGRIASGTGNLFTHQIGITGMHFHPDFKFRLMHIHLHIGILQNCACHMAVDRIRIHRKGLVVSAGDHLERMPAGILCKFHTACSNCIKIRIHLFRKGKGRDSEYLLQLLTDSLCIFAIQFNIETVIGTPVFQIPVVF